MRQVRLVPGWSWARSRLRLPITVYGDGFQVRSFTWVGAAVEAVVRLTAAPAAEGEVVNVGSDEAVTVRELAERVREAVG